MAAMTASITRQAFESSPLRGVFDGAVRAETICRCQTGGNTAQYATDRPAPSFAGTVIAPSVSPIKRARPGRRGRPP